MVGQERRLRIAEHMVLQISDLARSILRAHTVGSGAGDRGELWTLGFQRNALGIYFDPLPVGDGLGVAAACEESLSTMDALVVPGGLEDDWGVIREYLSAILTATRGAPEWPSIGPAPRATLRIDLLADMAEADGMARLALAASRVAGHLSAEVAGLSVAEVSWLGALARGEPVLDIAVQHDISNRALYRELQKLWAKLGVENTAQGIALASRMGWVGDRADAHSL